MPTAGEYKHEPSGIPCHCYVKRRLHHSTCKKSCLRKQSDSSPQYTDTKSKKVTFNPILSIRSYEHQPQTEDSDTRPLLNNCKHSADGIKTPNYDTSSSNTSTLCDKLTSLFGLNQQCRSSNDTKNPSRASSKHIHRRDHNNNVTDQGDKMHSKFCPICESKRNKSPVRGYHYQKTSERSPSPCGFHQQYPTSKAAIEPSRNQKRASSGSRVTPTIPANSKYHLPRRLFKRDSLANSSEEVSSQGDISAGYENMNTLTYVGSTVTDLDNSSVYINGDTDKNPRPVSIFIKGDREENKLEEYIYEVPINAGERAEYDYITVNNTNRAQSDSQKATGGTYSITRLIKHKTEADLTSTNLQDFTLRPKNPAPRSAPNLQSLSRPYDIRFVSERPRHPSPDDGNHVEMFTAPSTIDNSQTNTLNKTVKNTSPLIEILKMTPIAFFWTGCAFLVAIVYIFLFSCPYEHN